MNELKYEPLPDATEYIYIPVNEETLTQINGQIQALENCIRGQIDILETLRRLKVYVANMIE